MSEDGPVPPHTPGALRSEELMTDEDFVKAIEEMAEEGQSDCDIGELLKAMNENRIITWEEAERILNDTGNQPVKCSLPEQSRPTEPDNDTDVEQCVQRLLDNDPTLKEVNMNNMKRLPIPQIRRLLEAMAYNEHCERLSLANMGLYDNDIAVLLPVIEVNTALRKLNLETNYLSGDFFAKLFRAALVNQTLEEVKAVNQGVSFATVAEKEIIDCIVANTGLLKISVNLRLPEGRHKVENATLRNGELKRVLRREAARKAAWEAEELAKNPVPKLPKEPKKVPPKKAAATTAAKEPLAKAKDAKEAAPKSTPAVKKPTPTTTKPPVTKPSVPSTAKEKNASVVDKKDAAKVAAPKKDEKLEVTKAKADGTVPKSTAKPVASPKAAPKTAKKQEDVEEKPAVAPKKATDAKAAPAPPKKTAVTAKNPAETNEETDAPRPLKPSEIKAKQALKNKATESDEKKPTSIKVAALSRKAEPGTAAKEGAEQDRLKKAKDTAKKLGDQKAAKSESLEKPEEAVENGPASPAKSSEPSDKKRVTPGKTDKAKETSVEKKEKTPSSKEKPKTVAARKKPTSTESHTEANGVLPTEGRASKRSEKEEGSKVSSKKSAKDGKLPQAVPEPEKSPERILDAADKKNAAEVAEKSARKQSEPEEDAMSALRAKLNARRYM
ncbi:hypothetical protein V3C99_015094 [Haemonchus contortus]